MNKELTSVALLCTWYLDHVRNGEQELRHADTLPITGLFFSPFFVEEREGGTPSDLWVQLQLIGPTDTHSRIAQVSLYDPAQSAYLRSDPGRKYLVITAADYIHGGTGNIVAAHVLPEPGSKISSEHAYLCDYVWRCASDYFHRKLQQGTTLQPS